MNVELYDTTLRDGAQREGISFSVVDKLHIAQKLDDMGVHYIEGGWPGSNPKDAEFFEKAKSLHLKHAKLAAFGSTRKAGGKAETDNNVRELIDAGTPVVTVVGKTSEPQVVQVLETTLEENLAMVADTISYLKSKGLTVFYDAEHFFDGFKANADYALQVLKAASGAGADCLALCDTNGGSLPEEIVTIIGTVKKSLKTPLGIHVHNDGELAVANTLAAVKAGVIQVQGTINGYGERCGNANLCSIIPDLKLKLKMNCISEKNLGKLVEVSRFVAETANLALDAHLPYVGASAFSHKGGLHVSGIQRWADAYQHIDPAKVGNQPRVVVSELSGKSNIVFKAGQLGLTDMLQGKEARLLLDKIKLLESRGFQYENAEASFELLVRRAQPGYKPPFELVDFMVVIERQRRQSLRNNGEDTLSEAMVKVKVGKDIMHTAAEGNGPVNALDAALRKALCQFYPDLAQIKLTDYKVRILEESGGTGSGVRVLIESTDGTEDWHTVGSSANIIEASWLALADSLEYWLVKHIK
jgi:2-isopropylmalate synthase